MKKLDHTNELDFIFRRYWSIKLLYMDITKHDNGENYLKVINRKGLTNVYLLEDGDNAEKINARIKKIYDKITESNVYSNYMPFEKVMSISQELTKNDLVPRSVTVGLYREDSFYKGIFVSVSRSSDYKKDCNYLSVMPNGKKWNGY